MSQVSRVPPALRKLLEIDANITNTFVLYVNKILPLSQYRTLYKALEISCHGIPWFAFWIAFTWLFNNPALVEMQVNILLGLFIDIILIALCKAYFRRKRPMSNREDALGQLGPDVFSFPSGHASRAIFVAYFFSYLYPLHAILGLLVVVWACSVCLSRILMSRHFILDVLGGCVLGLINGFIMTVLWMDESTTMSLMSYLSDEKLDGGEYHV